MRAWDKIRTRHRAHPMQSDITVPWNRQRGPACGTHLGAAPAGFKTHRRFFWKGVQARSVPPVALATAATILAPTASISASVSVLSFGCIRTAIARDFAPSGTPLPS